MPSLLVLAAGLGSRYGGLKQIDPVGPSGETLLDYAVFDALRAGFGRVVFVIRRDFEAAFREKIGARYAGRAVVDFAFQALDDLPAGFSPPPGREKPWGTGHAVWCARSALPDNFAVINADDFYGADAFQKLSVFLGGDGRPARPLAPSALDSAAERTDAPAARPYRTSFAMIGFRLANTLSEHGTVARGICTAENGRLRSIVEQTDIKTAAVGAGKPYTGEEIVSMNCWGFAPALFPLLEEGLVKFLRGHAGDLKAEFYLPSAVSAMIAVGEAEVRVLPAAGSWFGITYREDKARVAAAIVELVRTGHYPEKLF